MDFYLLTFLLIIFIGSMLVYVYYLSEKKEQLNSIRRGFCPQCRQDSIELIEQRSEGCSGIQLLSYKCSSCEYANSFTTSSNDSCCRSYKCEQDENS